MKKLFSLLLILFVSFAIIGCGEKDPKPSEDNLLADEIAKVVIPERVTSSIYLPLQLANGKISVEWESSNEEVIASDGSFFMPETDTDLELKATYSYEGQTEVKTYKVQAYTRESGWAAAYKMYSSAVLSSYTKNSPFSAAKYKDYVAEFESLNPAVLDNNGVIVQKDFDQDVIVRITIKKGEEERVYYKRTIVKEYSNETYATYIMEWAEEQLDMYLKGEIDVLPSKHYKWPSQIEWFSGDNIAVTAEGTLIKPVEYVNDKIAVKVSYGALVKDRVIIEDTLEINNFGGNTVEGFYDQWLAYIMPTEIVAHKNVLKTGTDQFDYQYAVNTGAVLNLIDGKPLTFDKSYFIDIENETGLKEAWGGTHPELPNTLSSTNASSTKAGISSLDAFYEHFRPYYGWDKNATIAEKQAKYQEYKDNLPNEENILWIVVHESGMPFEGNNAELLARIQRQQADGERTYRQASWNYQIDHEKIYQSFDDTVYCWHAGGDYGKYLPLGNSNSIGIEMCINEDGNYDGAMHHDAKLVANLLYKYNLKMENVVRHHDTSGKICPNYMIETNRYNEFLGLVKDELNAIKYLRDAEVTWTISNPELFEKGPHGLYYSKAVTEITEVQVTLNVVKGNYTFEKTVTITLKPDAK